ncbi:MAG: hypothetical protein ACLUO4_06010 [Christensenellales bacterium]
MIEISIPVRKRIECAGKNSRRSSFIKRKRQSAFSFLRLKYSYKKPCNTEMLFYLAEEEWHLFCDRPVKIWALHGIFLQGLFGVFFI